VSTFADREDLLLQGALDLHAHGYPEFTLGLRPRVDNVQWAELAIAAGMRGFVMKSHMFPTTSAVAMLRGLHPGLETFGSITLNPPAGGLSPLAVEIAAQSGARVAWMPTWSARHPGHRPSIYLERMRPWLKTLDVTRAQEEDGLEILCPDGALKPGVEQILLVCRDYGVTVASGHLPVAASLVLCARAAELGVRFVLTHPLSGSVGASVDQQRQVAASGGLIEHVFIGTMPMHQRADPHLIVDAIRSVGAEHCVMSSDAIETWNPPAPEVMRMFIASMLALGLGEDEVHVMTHENPARALGLEYPWKQP
jgi:hypothetical protein